MEHMREVTVLRLAKEPPEITVRIQRSAGKEGLVKDMMRDIAETIQKRNRQSARTDGFQMTWRIELTEEEQALAKEWDAEIPVEVLREMERPVSKGGMMEVVQKKDRARGVIRRVCVAGK